MTNYKAIVNKTVWYQYKDRYANWLNRIESRNRPTQYVLSLIPTKVPRQFMRKKVFSSNGVGRTGLAFVKQMNFNCYLATMIDYR